MKLYFFFIFVVFVTASCRKDLCYEPEHPHGGNVEVIIDRSNMEGSKAEMQLLFYPIVDNNSGDESEGEPIVRFVKNGKGYINLANGIYNVIVFNDDTEQISFGGRESYYKIHAYMSNINRNQFSLHKTDKAGTPTIGQPEMLYTAFNEEFSVQRDVASQQLMLTPKNVVKSLNIKILVEGADRVAKVRGTLGGICSGILMHNQSNFSTEPASVFYDGFCRLGMIEAEINVFGFWGAYAEHSPEKPQPYVLGLELLLKDGNVVKYEVNITDKIIDSIIETGGEIIIDAVEQEIIIPELKPGGDGGFDVEVGDWGDEDDVPLQ